MKKYQFDEEEYQFFLRYEIGAAWWTAFAFTETMAKIALRYISRKTRRKYKRYIEILNIRESMKTIIFSALFLTACSKQHECECVSKQNGTPIQTVSYTIKDSKSNATTKCHSGNIPYDSFNGFQVDCDLR